MEGIAVAGPVAAVLVRAAVASLFISLSVAPRGRRRAGRAPKRGRGLPHHSLKNAHLFPRAPAGVRGLAARKLCLALAANAARRGGVTAIVITSRSLRGAVGRAGA